MTPLLCNAVFLVYTSTIGLEAAVAGKPVVVGGNIHYANRSFTFDADTAGQYWNILDQIPGGIALDLDTQTLARRYAYLFFRRFMHPIRAVRGDSSGAPRSTFDHLEALMPGNYLSLDRICDFILDSGDTDPANLIQ